MKEDLQNYNQDEIENRIFTIRGSQVMIDRDLAEMYEVETKRLNEQVKRNQNRFPDRFRFQLTTEERDELVANCDRLENLKHSSSMPYAFTEQGVAMLSAVLKSDIAVKVSIQIMEAFVEMRQVLGSHTALIQRMDRVELKLADSDQKFEKVFQALESGATLPKQGIYFDGQTFDAYSMASDLIRSAQKSIELVDNYIDDTVLLMLSKRKDNVAATIYCKQVSPQLQLDLDKHNNQYARITIKRFSKSHDRFLVIDREKVYHIGASMKDLGKKWFAFTELSADTVTILDRIRKI